MIESGKRRRRNMESIHASTLTGVPWSPPNALHEGRENENMAEAGDSLEVSGLPEGKRISNAPLKSPETGGDVKQIAAAMLVEEVPLNEADRERLVNYLSVYPKELLEYVEKTGFRIHVLADPPQKEGELKPTDLGFGDYDGDGVVRSDTWIDFNGNGYPDPWEYEGMVGIPDSNGDMHTLSLNEYIDGAYLPKRNCIYIFRGLASEKCPNAGKYTILHEFAHAIDFNMQGDPGLGERLNHLRNALYSACQKKVPGHEFIDLYQATNPYEFFAVSMQSYLTKEKLIDETGKFDIRACFRDNIESKDIHTSRFMKSFLNAPMNPGKWDDFTVEKGAAL